MQLNEFTNIFNLHFDTAFPIEMHTIHEGETVHDRKGWYTPKLKDSASKVNSLYNFSKVSDRGCAIYQRAKRDYINALDTAKRNYNSKKIKKAHNKSRMAWSLINSNINMKIKVRKDIIIKSRGEPIMSQQDIADTFNTYFGSSANELLKLNPPRQHAITTSNSKTNKTIFLRPIQRKELAEILDKISKKHSAGFDEIPCNLLKYVGAYIAGPLIHILNRSLSDGIFPSSLKKTKIIPVYKKKGDPEEVENYRPIAILSAFSKIFETAMYTRIESFIMSNAILNNSQHGFTKGRSTTSALTGFITNVLEALDNNKPAIGIFYD